MQQSPLILSTCHMSKCKLCRLFRRSQVALIKYHEKVFGFPFAKIQNSINWGEFNDGEGVYQTLKCIK